VGRSLSSCLSCCVLRVLWRGHILPIPWGAAELSQFIWWCCFGAWVDLSLWHNGLVATSSMKMTGHSFGQPAHGLNLAL
jgi:hypothetical protein